VVSLSLLAAAFTLGLLALPHCGSMCACQFAAPWLRKPLHFQAGRLLAYTLGGAAAGGASASMIALAVRGLGVFRALHWMLMAILVFSALLLILRGQTLGALVQERIRLPVALQRKLGTVQQPTASSSLKAGLLWLLMPCGVLWAALMLAYLAASPLQGGLIMGIFACVSGLGLQLVNSLRRLIGQRGGDAVLMRASGGVLLLGLVLIAARQVDIVSTPLWLQSLGFCL
jgi:uncharacterized protein